MVVVVVVVGVVADAMTFALTFEVVVVFSLVPPGRLRFRRVARHILADTEAAFPLRYDGQVTFSCMVDAGGVGWGRPAYWVRRVQFQL